MAFERDAAILESPADDQQVPKAVVPALCPQLRPEVVHGQASASLSRRGPMLCQDAAIMIEGDLVGSFQLAGLASYFPIADPKIELPVFPGRTLAKPDLGLDAIYDSASRHSNHGS